MGQRSGMTRTDLGKLFRLYECKVYEDQLQVDQNGIVVITKSTQ